MIRILYFARLKELLGLQTEEYSLDNRADSSSNIAVTDVDSLRSTLVATRGEKWKILLDPSTRVAVNQQLVQANARLNDGDEVAFFPPVTGG